MVGVCVCMCGKVAIEIVVLGFVGVVQFVMGFFNFDLLSHLLQAPHPHRNFPCRTLEKEEGKRDSSSTSRPKPGRRGGEGRGERGEEGGGRKGGEGGREKIFFRTIFGEEVENLWMNVGRYSETHLLDWFKHLLRV